MVSEVASLLASAKSVVVITGAGISAESGVPTFRGAEGLWRSYRPEELATPEAFARSPQLVWEWYRWRQALIREAMPNAGHLALARMEAKLPGFLLLTQNVDGLHELAGSRNLIELHGNIWRARCAAGCGRRSEQRQPAAGQAGESVPGCECGGIMRPDIVWFGEPLDPAAIDRAVAAVSACEVLSSVGTSAVVYPVAALPSLARRAGAKVVEVNVQETPLTSVADVVLTGKSAEILPHLESLV
jgi:NAD-dependent deacetylase